MTDLPRSRLQLYWALKLSSYNYEICLVDDEIETYLVRHRLEGIHCEMNEYG